MVLIDARFMAVARRSVCGASLKAATIGLWPVDDFHRIAQGHHRDRSSRHSRSLHDHTAVALAPAAGFRDGLSRTNADSRAKPDSNLERPLHVSQFRWDPSAWTKL
jgi:hypothetical protein